MLKIKKNTYPKDGIGKYKTGTFCNWRTERGHLLLSVVDERGNFVKNGLIYENIFSYGQVYALNGNLLSGKKEPKKVGVVAKFVKKGFFLELENCTIENKDIRENYLLIDSRGGMACANSDTNDLNKVDENWERYILLASKSKKEICHEANKGNYGANCVVANSNGQIFWEWFNEDGKWRCT